MEPTGLIGFSRAHCSETADPGRRHFLHRLELEGNMAGTHVL